MFDILDLLLEYSLNLKPLDCNFYDHVLSYYWAGTKGYLEKISYKPIKNNTPTANVYVPMAYSFYLKEIVIDEEAIKNSFINRMINYQMHGFDRFTSFLAFNSELLYDLLHEIDHSVQFKKGAARDNNFENLLFHLCFYGDIEMLGRGELKRFFFENISFSEDTQLWQIYKSLSHLNNQFARLVPYERIGQITAAKQVLGLLEVLNSDKKKIPDLLKFYKYFVYDQYKLGYDESVSPLNKYLDVVRSLGQPKLNNIIDKLENKESSIDGLEERIRYGLPVSKNELSDFKRRVLK